MKPSTSPGLKLTGGDTGLQCLTAHFSATGTQVLSIAAVTVPVADRLQLSKAHEFFPGTNDRVLLISGSLKVVSASVAWLELQDSMGCPDGNASDHLIAADLYR